MRGWRRLWLPVPGMLLFGAAACGGPAQLRYEQRVEKTPAAAEHSVHSERLVELMRGLDRLRFERLPKAMDVEIERERQVREIEEVARSIARSAEQIPAAADRAQLDETERQEFLERADILRRKAEALGEESRRLTSEQLRAEVEAISETCDGCHARFRIGSLRDPSGGP